MPTVTVLAITEDRLAHVRTVCAAADRCSPTIGDRVFCAFLTAGEPGLNRALPKALDDLQDLADALAFLGDRNGASEALRTLVDMRDLAP